MIAIVWLRQNICERWRKWTCNAICMVVCVCVFVWIRRHFQAATGMAHWRYANISVHSIHCSMYNKHVWFCHIVVRQNEYITERFILIWSAVPTLGSDPIEFYIYIFRRYVHRLYSRCDLSWLHNVGNSKRFVSNFPEGIQL